MIILELREEIQRAKAWIDLLEEFIRNGYDMGYIKPPIYHDDKARYTLQQLGCID